MLVRTKLTEEENEFFRTMLYRVTSSMKYGQPALRRAFIALIPHSVLGSRTMSIDAHWRVYIDFAEMQKRGLDYACGILNHEIWHVLRKHVERLDELPPAPQGYKKEVLANLAEDLEINDDIEDLLPAASLMPGRHTFRDYEKYKDRSVYYAKILENLPELEKQFPDMKQRDPFQPPQQQDADQNDESGQDEQGQSGQGQQGQSQQVQGQSGEGEQGQGSDQSGQGQSGQGQSGQGQSGQGQSGQGQSGQGQSGQGQSGQGQSGNGQSGQGQSGQGQSGQGQSGQGQSGQGQSGQGQSGQGQSGQGQSGNGQSGNGQSGQGQQGNGQQGNGQSGQDEGEQEGDFWSQTPQCGGAAGNSQDYEFVDVEGDGSEGSQGVSESDQNSILDGVAKDIQEFLAKGIGNSHGNTRFRSMADWADQRKRSKYIPWKQELRGTFKQSYSMQRGKVTYDRSRPSRRQPVPEVMFPAMRAPRPTIGIGFDVSGSNLGNLRLMTDELVNIMKASGVRGADIKAFAVDTQASDTKIVNDPLKVLDNLVGGGGTRMKPGYEKLAEIGNDISILVTDGYVDDYPKEMPRSKGKGRSKFITCVILEGDIQGDPHDHGLIKKAKQYMGKWSKVIPIVVTEKERAKAGY